MSRFQDDVRTDIVNEFLDNDFFAERHVVNVNGRRSAVAKDDESETETGEQPKISCVIDDDVRKADPRFTSLGVQDCDCVLYAREKDIPRGHAGDHITIDGLFYTVVQWRIDMGMHRVSLTGPQSY